MRLVSDLTVVTVGLGATRSRPTHDSTRFEAAGMEIR